MITRYQHPSVSQWASHRESMDTPTILDGLMVNWPAMTKWSIDYFRERWGQHSVRACTHEKGEHRYDQSRPISLQFIEMLDCLSRNDGKEKSIFLTQLRLTKELPGCLEDITIPACVLEKEVQLTSLWMAAKGTATHLHWDSLPGMLALVRGRKMIQLYSPDRYQNLYPVAENEARLNWSQVDFLRPDHERFPAYAEVSSINVELCAGEILYIPQYWWHSVRNLEFSFGIQFLLTGVFRSSPWVAFYHHRQKIGAERNRSGNVPT